MKGDEEGGRPTDFKILKREEHETSGGRINHRFLSHIVVHLKYNTQTNRQKRNNVDHKTKAENQVYMQVITLRLIGKYRQV